LFFFVDAPNRSALVKTRLRAGFLMGTRTIRSTSLAFGWAGGAGVEFALGHGWTAGLEYLHVSLDGPSATVGTVPVNTSAVSDIGRIKFNYLF
jgi:opacity protein-like surface antigen